MRQGWYATGDVGYLDGEGYLYLTDRKAFTIISGGVNIYPQEIEDLLQSHPAVADAAVFGAPNDVFGEEVKAVVVLASPENAGDPLAGELFSFWRANLASVKVPRSIDFRESLPRLATGKLLKRQIRDEYWAGHSR